MVGDTVIKFGFWSQFVFLLMVDLGTLHAMREGLVDDIHYGGIVIVNLVCIGVGILMWRWLRKQSSAEMN